MTFEDLLWTLQHQVLGGFVEASISLSPAGDEIRAEVASFCGILEAVEQSDIREGEWVLRIRLAESHESAEGSIRLQRGAFKYAEELHGGLPPLTLNVWQRGARISLGIYVLPAHRSSDLALEGDDEILF